MKPLLTLAFMLLLVKVSDASAQQITARFYPEKQEYLVGEPITVVFEVVNGSDKPAEIGEEYCSWNPGQFEVDGATPKKKTGLFGCGRENIAGDCLVSTREIAPSGKYVRRWLLEGPFELDSPGTYHIRAKREQEILGKDSHDILADLRVESEFDVTLRAPQDGELESAYQPLLNDLNSKDIMVRNFAASAITQEPPAFAEAAILSLADDPQIPTASIDGLARLATPPARAKLLQMSSNSSPEYVRQPAIQALGEIKNPDDCQAMLDIGGHSEDYTQGEAYIVSGRVCKEQAISPLLRLLPKADSHLLMYLAVAFANTLSRSAVPPLISLLTNSNEYVRRDAEAALANLTHRRSQYGIANLESANRSSGEWSNWWATNGNRAPVYGADECADPQPLHLGFHCPG